VKLTLERKIALGFGACLLVLFLVAVAAWWSVARFNRTQRWVNHTRDVLSHLDQARGHVLEMQAAIRGFVLTGNDNILRPFDSASGQLDIALDRLRRLTADDPQQQHRLDLLTPRVAHAREQMRSRIETRRETGSALADPSTQGQGQRAVDAVVALLTQLAEHERSLLNDRLTRAENLGRLTVLTILAAGAVTLLLGAFAARQVRRDLRRRREAEHALQESLARIEDLYHHAPCGYHSLDADGRFLAINDTALGWLGHTRDEVVGRRNCIDVLTPKSAALFADRFERFKEAGVAHNVEYEWRRKDGTSFPILLNATAVYDRRGAYVASRATVFEITRLKHAEAERDRFFTLSRDLLCVADFDGICKRVNPAWETVLGFTPDEITAQRFLDFVHPDDRERTRTETERLARGEETVDFENRYRCRDGSYRWLHWNARSAPAERLIYASARDVTERKEAEQRIQNLNSTLATRATELEAANQELEAFSYSVSHDLRAPLRHIDGFASLLVNKLGESADTETRRYVTTITRAARHMGTLIDNLLGFSRIGRVTLQRKRVDQNRLVADVISDGHHQKNGPPIAWQIGPLPDVHGDAALLRQVWTNLIDNAVKYSSKNSHPRIEIGANGAAEAGEHVFFVRDNGVGFDMAYADKLFGVFQRLHSPAEFEGTGIGLANVRRIVKRHGGRTWAEGRVGQGAVIYFTLPADPAPESKVV